MEHITVQITTPGGFRSTEIMADLRQVAQTLYHPLRPITFWDIEAQNAHLCPQENQGHQCPHVLPSNDPSYVDYSYTVEHQMNGILEVYFPHAQVYIYLK